MAEAEPIESVATAPSATRAEAPPGRTSFLDAPVQISDALRSLRNQQARVQIRFDEDPTLYSARILDVTGSELLLEDVVPRSGLRRMTPGCRFAFSARGGAMYLHSAENRLSRVDEERGVPFFRIPLPTTVLFQQRRRTPRHRLPLAITSPQVTVTLYRNVRGDRDHASDLAGRMVEVSADGCRIEIRGPVHPPLAEDEVLKGCTIDIPNLLEIGSGASVRHASYDKRSRTVTCGVEFTKMPITDRRRLEQFLRSLAKVTGHPGEE